MKQQVVIYALIVTAILTSVGLGQESAKPGISPVPLWPQDGNIPENMKDRNVFFNPRTNEVVVSLEDSTGRKNLSFDLRNQAEAITNSQVSKQKDGLYFYEYTVSAGNNTKRPLKTWSLLVPADDRQFNAQPPAAWRRAKGHTDGRSERGAPRALDVR